MKTEQGQGIPLKPGAGYLSISRKLTWFYSGALIILLIIFYLFLYFLSSRMLTHGSEVLMERAVRDTVNEMEIDGNRIYIAEDIDLFHEGVTIILYDSAGDILLGSRPSDFPRDLALVNDRHRELAGIVPWRVYDRFVESQGTGLWVRGIYAVDQANNLFSNITLVLIISFPILILLVILIGYVISKRTLQPLADLTAKVRTIGTGRDLSVRLPETPSGQKSNEITDLSHSFNQMLDRLQNTFLKEQQFTSDASHELRTPVAAILAQSEAGLLPDSTEADKTHSLERIFAQGKNMEILVSQLLELTRADRGSIELSMEEINLSDLAGVVWESLQEKAEEVKIDLRHGIDPDLYVKGDEVLLMRMMINLVTNGLKYTNPGGNVSINLRRDTDFALLSVTDNGIGIAEEHQERIFDRFYRVSQDRTRHQAYSSGLGLAMVRWIVETHGGRIEVKSTPNVGSQFMVWLPLIEVESGRPDYTSSFYERP